MRHQSREYLAKFLEEHKKIKKVLDVGSLNVTGTIKDIFENKGIEYTGVDMRGGDNVDIVLNAHELSKKLVKKFDLVVCFDTMEHDDAFWLTMEEIKKVTKKGGWIMIGVPSRYCPEHDHPGDYWRFMPQSLPKVLLRDLVNVKHIIDRQDQMEDEIYAWGQKPL